MLWASVGIVSSNQCRMKFDGELKVSVFGRWWSKSEECILGQIMLAVILLLTVQ